MLLLRSIILSVGLDNDEVTDKVMNDSDVDVKKSWDQMGRELKDERIHYLIGLAIQYGTPLTTRKYRRIIYYGYRGYK